VSLVPKSLEDRRVRFLLKLTGVANRPELGIRDCCRLPAGDPWQDRPKTTVGRCQLSLHEMPDVLFYFQIHTLELFRSSLHRNPEFL
jgi:hypothetical protein